MPTAKIAAYAVVVADSAEAASVDVFLAALSAVQVRSTAGTSLAAARRALQQGREAEHVELLRAAQLNVDPDDEWTVARIAFLLGASSLAKGEVEGAEIALGWGEATLAAKTESLADIEHLRALVHEAHGDRRLALDSYRRAIRASDAALTGLSRVLALRNLAEALSHEEPRESVALYAMARHHVEADAVDPSVLAPIDNGLGYALLCRGDLSEARKIFLATSATAGQTGHTRAELNARFNLSIVDELAGHLAAAERHLRSVAAEARRLDWQDTARWSAIRLLWVAFRAGDLQRFDRDFAQFLTTQPPRMYRDTTATLFAIRRSLDDPAQAAEDLIALSRRYLRRRDLLTAFALQLWSAHALLLAGRRQAAAKQATAALEAGAENGFVLSPNWWSPEVVATARMLGGPHLRGYTERLITPGVTVGASRSRVELRGESIFVDSIAIAEERWRVGRTGRRVLHRYLGILVRHHPAGVTRDELVDALWPESDGDAAVRNLYGATHDLRTLLGTVPGVDLAVKDGWHRVRLGTSASVLGTSGTAKTVYLPVHDTSDPS